MKIELVLSFLLFVNLFFIRGRSFMSIVSAEDVAFGELQDLMEPVDLGEEMMPLTTNPGSEDLSMPQGVGESRTFNIKDYGAKGDGKTNDCKAIEEAWKAACESSGSPKVFIPKGSYLSGPLKFNGPCKCTSAITFQMEGNLLASTDLAQFTDPIWIQFSWINRLTITGGGTFDGQGSSSWSQNECPTKKECKVLPMNIMFNSITNTTMNKVNSINSKFFHIGIVNCHNFTMSGLEITAPEDSPNTDGIHIERSTGITILDSNISTGDDCISIGHGNSDIIIQGINCGPGHGISVGSLGRYPSEQNLSGLLVKNCTLTGTMYGARIKTWENSPVSTVACNITFEDIVMKNVGNPVYVDQTYCPYVKCDGTSPSRVKLQDITFRNIRGTSATPVAVTLECSKGMPCENVIVENVHLEHSGGAKPTSLCQNVKAQFIETQVPPPCA